MDPNLVSNRLKGEILSSKLHLGHGTKPLRGRFTFEVDGKNYGVWKVVSLSHNSLKITILVGRPNTSKPYVLPIYAGTMFSIKEYRKGDGGMVDANLIDKFRGVAGKVNRSQVKGANGYVQENIYVFDIVVK